MIGFFAILILFLGSYGLEYDNIKLDDAHIVIGHRDSNRIPIIGHLGGFLSSEEIKDSEQYIEEDVITMKFSGSRLTIRPASDLKNQDITCQEVGWIADDCRQDVFEDCYSMVGSHWYGGAPMEYLDWPIEKWDVDFLQFTTGDILDFRGVYYGNVLERYWLNSNGDAFFVDLDAPLWVSINKNGSQELCFRSTYEGSTYKNFDNTPLYLNYTVCQSNDMLEMQKYAIENHLNKPFDIPDEALFRYPIYSTWARFSDGVNQTLVLDYAREINANNFSNAQMEIDDNWEVNYGMLDFDPVKFPDPAEMVLELKTMGFRTTVWVHPFVDMTTEYAWWGGLLFVFLKDPGGLLPALTVWWNGVAAVLDFTDPDAVTWYTEHLNTLRTSYGIDSFKFDAGEAHYMPASYIPYVPYRNPSHYSTDYVELAYQMDTAVRHQEVRTGYRTQHLPIFTRIMDKDSRWGYDNGLKSLIPHVLLFSIIGYVFPLPDMIGGNAYAGEFPDRELFIRWTEVNVLMPGFQFSISPWQYDDEVTDICREMLQLHEQYADLMIELARNATVSGEPIIRPLWWVSPSDPIAQEIDSEFLVGNDILAAPVLEPGAISRDIYLPDGTWEDANNPGSILDGEMWYTDYPAPLHVLPYFIRSN